MKMVPVEVKPDFLERMARTKPVLALAELVWNSLDADAGRIEVRFGENPLGGLRNIEVIDDGTGIPLSESEALFSSLGGSWKSNTHHSRQERRLLHGENGQGRFRAFALGQLITWKTCSKNQDDFVAFTISARRSKLATFSFSDPEDTSNQKTGTIVTVENVDELCESLRGEQAKGHFARIFAPYLRKYPSVSLMFDGEEIDAAELVEQSATYDLGPFVLSGGSEISAELEVIEWAVIRGRALYLCDERGFTMAERSAEIRAPGFDFGAYLKSSYFRELAESALIDLDDMNEGFGVLTSSARSKLQEHFKRRADEISASLIDQWKSEEVYPYRNDPKGNIEENERRIFNMCAVTVHNYVKGFEEQDRKSKALAFRLLRQTLEGNPKELSHILSEVLNLPKEKREEFSYLLEKAPLSAIIDASKEVTERLDLLKGLEVLLFKPKPRQRLKEREQLQRIIANNAWVFGESYNLSFDDKSLTEVLKRHLISQNRKPELLDPVLRIDGSKGIVDLMVSRRIPRSNAEEREHLVIELKRPSERLKGKHLEQLKSYAYAVANDARFRETKTKWIFWLVGTELDDYIRTEVTSIDRDEGCAQITKEGLITIWVKTWGQIIQEAEARLEFYRERLDYDASEDTGVEFLMRTYRKYIPEIN